MASQLRWTPETRVFACLSWCPQGQLVEAVTSASLPLVQGAPLLLPPCPPSFSHTFHSQISRNNVLPTYSQTHKILTSAFCPLLMMSPRIWLSNLVGIFSIVIWINWPFILSGNFLFPWLPLLFSNFSEAPLSSSSFLLKYWCSPGFGSLHSPRPGQCHL